MRIDGEDYVYGTDGSPLSPPANAPPAANSQSVQNTSTWQLTPAVTAMQTLSIVPGPSTGNQDTALIQYNITNHDSVPHQIGSRVMIDTMLNNNDGAAFVLPAVGAVTTGMSFTGPVIPQYWQAFYRRTSSPHSSS